MDSEKAITIIISEAEIISLLGAKFIALFGSVARDEARQDSDVDILVEFDEPPTFDKYMELKLYLESLLNKKVDLVDWDMLRPEVRPNVERDIIPIISPSS